MSAFNIYCTIFFNDFSRFILYHVYPHYTTPGYHYGIFKDGFAFIVSVSSPEIRPFEIREIL